MKSEDAVDWIEREVFGRDIWWGRPPAREERDSQGRLIIPDRLVDRIPEGMQGVRVRKKKRFSKR